MNGCDSRRYWIGGEGLPSRYQVREKREQRQSQVGFSRLKPQQQGHVIWSWRIVFECVYAGFSGDKCVYT
jgi:hypothetical protein